MRVLTRAAAASLGLVLLGGMAAGQDDPAKGYPAKPIRIIVKNGRVTLEGVVDSQGDKDLAGIRAKSVPGTFEVTNNLQVQQP